MDHFSTGRYAAVIVEAYLFCCPLKGQPVRYESPTILMCPPDFYGIEYEINPWMNRQKQSDSTAARQQWLALKELLERLGATILLMPPVKGLPDLVFTANAGLVFGETVYLARFRHAARQPESFENKTWFEAQGFQTIELPSGMDFEGAGDALFCGETLFAGYIIRSDARAEQWLGAQMQSRVIPLQLIDTRYYHLDTCFCPLSLDEALWFPEAFDEYGQAAIRQAIPKLIAVDPVEAARFACNAVVVGQHVVLNTGCPKLEQTLTERGYRAWSTSLDEFLKAGGSAKCLTLRLDGEAAASWRTER